MSDPFLMACVGGIGAIGGLMMLGLCLKRYEITIFLMGISPMISAMFVQHNLGYGAYQATTFGSYGRVSVVLLCGIAGLIKFFQAQNKQAEKMPLPLLLFGLYGLLALASVTYSLDQQFTLIRSVSFISFICFLFGTYAWLDEAGKIQRLLSTLFYVVVTLVAANLLAAVLISGHTWFRGLNRFCGLWGHPNIMGLFSLISYPVLCWKYYHASKREKWLVLGTAAILVTLHVLTGSRSTVLTGVIGFSVWSIMLQRYVRLMSLMLFAGLGGLVLFQIFTPSAFQRGEGNESSITTLNGREEFWIATLVLIQEEPLLGYGYGIGGKVWEDPRFQGKSHLWAGSVRSSLHNGYLSKIVELGILGFGIWFLVIIYSLWKAHSLPFPYIRAFVFATMSMLLILNFVEEGISNGAKPGDLPFWVAFILVLKLVATLQSRKTESSYRDDQPGRFQQEWQKVSPAP